MNITTYITLLTALATFFIVLNLWLNHENSKLRKIVKYYEIKEEKQNESTTKNI